MLAGIFTRNPIKEKYYKIIPKFKKLIFLGCGLFEPITLKNPKRYLKSDWKMQAQIFIRYPIKNNIKTGQRIKLLTGHLENACFWQGGVLCDNHHYSTFYYRCVFLLLLSIRALSVQKNEQWLIAHILINFRLKRLQRKKWQARKCKCFESSYKIEWNLSNPNSEFNENLCKPDMFWSPIVSVNMYFEPGWTEHLSKPIKFYSPRVVLFKQVNLYNIFLKTCFFKLRVDSVCII